MSQFKQLTGASFAKTLNEHDCVVVDFWAEWCQPCKNFEKVMEQAAAEYSQVVFAQVDIDKEPELAADFQIVSVPFVMIVRYQTIVYAEAGLLSLGSLKELIDGALKLTAEEIAKRKA